ncbi:hypothetical protein MPTK1_2g00870 [Marchantia polymorpha subsp. ruderalis]|nr:hypothetical protein MARPO_0028s0064 [Marchantia polymorpha]BBN00648.1 hypothetical protein Mp_2g00870 [Marchantia polymorpha subsp. ruderalis]|eukprot:PTQ42748.1 hypothetical protein MARPO_0028s0064 [Marchantia polymorpha]
MSRAKKKRMEQGATSPALSEARSNSPHPTAMGQKGSTNNSNRPKHTYSLKFKDSHRAKSPAPKPRARPGDGAVEVPVETTCAALPALVIPSPCRTRSPSPTPKRYHQTCTPSPRPHTPRTKHKVSRDFDSYVLRQRAQKAIKHSRRFAADRRSDRQRERCRYYSCSPPPMKTRHKHYCGHKPYRKDRTVLQMVGNVLEKGLNAFKSLIEDGPIGDSARYCRRRIKRLLRPIWCTCLTHTCLGPPADPVQRHVYSRGRKCRDRARSTELMRRFPRLPTPMPSSGEGEPSSPESVPRAAASREPSPAPDPVNSTVSSEPQLQQTKAPKASESPRAHEQQQQPPPQPPLSPSSSPKNASHKGNKNFVSLAQLKRADAKKP